MAKYSNTKAKINEKITTNGAQNVTGSILNDVLQTMVDSLGADYQFGGLVQPGSSFTAGEQPVVFLATTTGTYTNFGGLVVADGEVALLVWSGSAWSKQTPDIATRTEVGQLGQEVDAEFEKCNGALNGEFDVLLQGALGQINAELPIILKQDVEYVLYLDDFPTTDVNLYKDSARTQFINNFTTTNKYIYFKSDADYTKLYSTIYTTLKTYNIHVKVLNHGVARQYDDNRLSYEQAVGAYKLDFFSTSILAKRDRSFKYYFKAGVKYIIECNPKSGILNLYASSTRSDASYIGSLGTNSVEFTPSTDIDTLYTRDYSNSGLDGVREILIYNGDSLPNKVAELVRNKPRAVIFDTDFGGDQDDIGGVSIMAWAARNGLIRIAGLVQGLVYDYTKDDINVKGIPALDAFMTYFGFNEICYGLEHRFSEMYDYDPTTHLNKRRSAYLGKACDGYAHSLASNGQSYPSALYYRKALSNLKDGEKCDIFISGYLIGFSDFLNTTADDISPLTGLEMAEQKINRLWIVGGCYDINNTTEGYEYEGALETNFAGNPTNAVPICVAATNNVLTNFPNEIVFLGPPVGDRWAHQLYDDNHTWSMIYQLMLSYCNNNRGEIALETYWKAHDGACDGTMMLAVVENHFAMSGMKAIRGTNSIITTSGEHYGHNLWTNDSQGKHIFLTYIQGANKGISWSMARKDSIIAEQNWGGVYDNSAMLPRGTFHQVVHDVTYTITQGNWSVNIACAQVKNRSYRIYADSPVPTNGYINIYYDSSKSSEVVVKHQRVSDTNEVNYVARVTSDVIYATCYFVGTYTLHVVEEWMD